MTPQRLIRLVSQSIRRNTRDFLFSSIGIVIGISTLLFFTALGSGIKETVLERVFVVRQLEIEKKTYDVGLFKSEGGLFGSKKLDDAVVEKLRAQPGVASVFPKMRLTFPTGLTGGKEIIGQDLRSELVADGIPIDFVQDDVSEGAMAFKDWDAPISCSGDDSCPGGYACVDGTCAGKACNKKNAMTTCPAPAYCDLYNGRVCNMPIPVVASPQMLEVYNSSVHTALSGLGGAVSKLPKLSERALIGVGADVFLGKSFFLGASATGDPVRRRIRLVGFSDKAINFGATMPIEYVRRYNQRFNPTEGGKDEYHSIVVVTESNDAIAGVARVVTEDLGFALSEKYEQAQRASLMILLITLVFNLIAAIILAVAAVNIMHTFLMIILERRREIGLMRALGATSGQIRVMILAEATVLGIFGAVLGVIAGFLATLAVDAVFTTQVQDFPFKPDTLFVFEPWMFGVCMGAALLFCWIGALIPALRASRIDPASALTGR